MADAPPIRQLVMAMAALPEALHEQVIAQLPEAVQAALWQSWDAWAHDGQRDPDERPPVWLMLAGRGFGKTRAGAEWVSEQARNNPRAQIALVGATTEDVARVMIEGPSGLIAVARHGEPIRWRKTAGIVEFASGAKAFVYSAHAAEALRGPEHHLAWCDELGKWRDAAAWDNLMMGLRGGDAPRVLVTTTPRATQLMRKVEALATATGKVTRGRTADNPHLPPSFVAAMVAEYGGTRLGRQELDGVLVGEVEGALWTRAALERGRMRGRRATLTRVVVGVDPPAGSASASGGDACGIVAVGLGDDGVAHVLEDASVAGLSPDGWARAVAACAARWGAERVVAEKNQGGDMVASVLLAADARLPVRLVHASRGKAARAEPIAALYERGRVRHAGVFPELEDEMCGLSAGGGYDGPTRSPDRADALVWALTELMLGRGGKAGVRVV